MSFIFFNTWPYTPSIMPSMDDHVDPANHTYYEGLMRELKNIEHFLGLEVARGFADVRHKLEGHSHTGGYDGALLYTNIKDLPTLGDGQTFFGPATYYGSFSGFGFYNCFYFGPGTANDLIQSVSTINDDYHFESHGHGVSPSGGASSDGTYIYYSILGDPPKVIRFNPATWQSTLYTADSQGTHWLGSCYLNGKVYIGLSTSPAKLQVLDIAGNSWNTYTMDSGQNDCRGVATDGTYVYMALNTSPSIVLRFNPSDNTHIAKTISTISGEPFDFQFVNGILLLHVTPPQEKIVKIYVPSMDYLTIEFPETASVIGLYSWQAVLLGFVRISSVSYSYSTIPGSDIWTKSQSLNIWPNAGFIRYYNNYIFGSSATNYKLQRFPVTNIPIQ